MCVSVVLRMSKSEGWRSWCYQSLLSGSLMCLSLCLSLLPLSRFSDSHLFLAVFLCGQWDTIFRRKRGRSGRGEESSGEITLCRISLSSSSVELGALRLAVSPYPPSPPRILLKIDTWWFPLHRVVSNISHNQNRTYVPKLSNQLR